MCIPIFDDYIRDVLSPLLPNARFSHQSDDGSVHLRSNKDLDGSIYEMKNLQEQRFVHFTSLGNLFEILNSETIRLYNFASLDDPKEYIYAWEKEKQLKDNNQIGKDNDQHFSFILSMCQITDNNDEDYFNMWRLYGDNGKGVGIVFKFENDPSIWNNYLLSNVLYGDEKKGEIDNLIQRHIDYKGEKTSNIRNGILNYIGPFHKQKCYSSEKEVRLLIPARAMEENAIDNFHNYKNGKRTQYATLPLNGKKHLDELLKKRDMTKPNSEGLNTDMIKFNCKISRYTQMPHLAIDSIIIGYRHKSIPDKANEVTTFETIKGIINDITIRWPGEIKITSSKISKYF
jgi:hypothetical protein